MSTTNWQKIIDGFAKVSVLVIGDVMLDRYFWGTVSRISPEAPVPVVKLEKVTVSAGGAANVAANIASLGAKPILVGIIGDDEGGRELPKVLEKNNVSGENLICFANRPTTTKTRIVAHHQHVVRIDDEDSKALSDEQSREVWEKIGKILPEIEIVVLSDYAKGCLTEIVIENVIETAKKFGKRVLVDPKGKNYQKYNGANLLTPNRLEAAAATGTEIFDEDSIIAAGEKLLENVKLDAALITLGEDGMMLFERNKKAKHFHSLARDVYDVTGAGDTVIAALSIALGAGADFSLAAQIANTAAGIAVEQVGTTAVTGDELRLALQKIDETAGLKK